jgi:hypothetical protein
MYRSRARRRPSHRQRLKDYVCNLALSPFRYTHKLIRQTRVEIQGHEEYYQRWPEPVPVCPFPRPEIVVPQNKQPTEHTSFFRLPVEIRVQIYNYVFSYPDIHLAQIEYEDRHIREFRLLAYACIANQHYRQSHMCRCLLDGSDWAKYDCTRPTRYTNHRPPSCFPLPRAINRPSDAGLWELTGMMYASKQLYELNVPPLSTCAGEG